MKTKIGKMFNVLGYLCVCGYITCFAIQRTNGQLLDTLVSIQTELDALLDRQSSFETQLKSVESRVNQQMMNSMEMNNRLMSLTNVINKVQHGLTTTDTAVGVMAQQTGYILSSVGSSNEATEIPTASDKNQCNESGVYLRFDNLEEGQLKLQCSLSDVKSKSEKGLELLNTLGSNTQLFSANKISGNMYRPRTADVKKNKISTEWEYLPKQGHDNCTCFYPKDCTDIFLSVQKTNGLYYIYPNVEGKLKPIKVYCDMTTSTGGWTVIQRRNANFKPRIHFNRTLAEYKEGFGRVDKEFFLGLDDLSWMTSSRNYKLRIDLNDFENNHRYAEYNTFTIGNEQSGYLLNVRDFKGNAGSGMELQNNMRFSTRDVDNDINNNRHCARERDTAWWFKHCEDTHLNGPATEFLLKDAWNGIIWRHWRGAHYSLMNVEMKIRLNSFY